MNFVAVTHPGDQNRSLYLFQIPDFDSCSAGTIAIADTIRGKNQICVCATDSFAGNPDIVLPLWGVNLGKLKKLKAKFCNRYDFFYGEESPLLEPPGESERK